MLSKFSALCLAIVIVVLAGLTGWAAALTPEGGETSLAVTQTARFADHGLNPSGGREIPQEFAFHPGNQAWGPVPSESRYTSGPAVEREGGGERLQDLNLEVSARGALLEEPYDTGIRVTTMPEWISGFERPLETADQIEKEAYDAALRTFAASLSRDLPERVIGVYVPEILSLPVSQQPPGSPGFVSWKDGIATQFRLAAEHGSIGLLAHNYLAGALFYELQIGQTVYLVMGDGRLQAYRIREIQRYQALQPNSPRSDFLKIGGEEEVLPVTEVFDRIYEEDGRLIFQTCIARGGLDTWGRLFVVAVPLGWETGSPAITAHGLD